MTWGGGNTDAAATLPLLSVDGSTQLTEMAVEAVSVAVLGSWLWSWCERWCWLEVEAERL